MSALCDIAGARTPKDIDGLSIAPTLLGRPGQKLREYLSWEYHSGGGAQAVRFGDWPLHRRTHRSMLRTRALCLAPIWPQTLFQTVLNGSK